MVVAFGMEDTEIKNYEKYLGRAREVGLKTVVKTAFVLGFFFFCMFGYYAYAFYVGTLLIENGKYNDNSHAEYTSGDILSCFFGVVFGVFALGMATPNIKAITEG